jgi:transposase
MRKGQLVFAQLTAFLPRAPFNDAVAQYGGRYPTLSFSHWDQLLCMLFAQLTGRQSLRDVTTCLRSCSHKLYFAGFRSTVARSTLADANERRDSRIFESLAVHMMQSARRLYASETIGADLQETAYAMDSTTVDLCLGLFGWTPSAKGRAGIKMHTLLDLRGNIPSVIRITPGRVHDATFIDQLQLEGGSFYVMDRGYFHAARLMRFTSAAAFFVIRTRKKMQHRVLQQCEADAAAGVLCDEHVLLTGQWTGMGYPVPVRRIEFHDAQHDRVLMFLTNNFELDALAVAKLYKSRWQIELFFKWIKQHLRIKTFIGNSPNAVSIQIWTAITAYVLIAIVKKQLGITASLHAILQILSLNLFEKTSLMDLLEKASSYEETEPSQAAQLQLL